MPWNKDQETAINEKAVVRQIQKYSAHVRRQKKIKDGVIEKPAVALAPKQRKRKYTIKNRKRVPISGNSSSESDTETAGHVQTDGHSQETPDANGDESDDSGSEEHTGTAPPTILGTEMVNVDGFTEANRKEQNGEMNDYEESEGSETDGSQIISETEMGSINISPIIGAELEKPTNKSPNLDDDFLQNIGGDISHVTLRRKK